MRRIFLDDLDGLMEILLYFSQFLKNDFDLESIGFMYCATCREECRMHINISHFEKTVLHKQLVLEKDDAQLLESSDDAAFLTYACVNCLSLYWAFIHPATGQKHNLALHVFPQEQPMLSTKNTPEDVAYFLEQAYLAQLVSAHSAAMGMYRSALDKFLAGGDKLEKRIEDLKELVNSGKAPKWAKTLSNNNVLTLLKEIGDTHMHANDLSKLESLDSAKLHRVQALMSYLVKQKYEREPEREASLTKVRRALSKNPMPD